MANGDNSEENGYGGKVDPFDGLSAEEKKAVAKRIKQTMAEAEGTGEKAFSFLLKNNLIPYILIALLVYFSPQLLKMVFPKSAPSAGFVEPYTSYPIFNWSERAPSSEFKTKIEVKSKQIENGKEVDKPISVWIEGDPEVLTAAENIDVVEVKRYNSRVDFNLKFGIAGIVNPIAEDSKDIVEPALVISPVNFFQDVMELDGFVTPKSGGVGMSFRVPVKKLHNLYLGGGVAFPFDTEEPKHGVVYLKVNF